MNTQVSLERNSFRLWYYRYKDSAIYSISVAAGIVLVSLVLFFTFIIPQFHEWFSVKREVASTEQKIAVLNQNLHYLSTLDQSEVDTNYQAALHALPADNDLTGIVNAINASVLMGNVSVGEFSFSPGLHDTKISQGLQATTVELSVKGSLSDVRGFLTQLSKKVPVIEVKSVQFGSDTSNVNVVFYTKALPKVTVVRTDPLQNGDANADLLSKLKDWDSQTQGVDTFTGSAAATFSSPF